MTDASFTALLFLAFIVAQRLSELVIARRNTQRLLSEGGYEVGASHYPLIVSLHVLWIMHSSSWLRSAGLTAMVGGLYRTAIAPALDSAQYGPPLDHAHYRG